MFKFKEVYSIAFEMSEWYKMQSSAWEPLQRGQEVDAKKAVRFQGKHGYQQCPPWNNGLYQTDTPRTPADRKRQTNPREKENCSSGQHGTGNTRIWTHMTPAWRHRRRHGRPNRGQGRQGKRTRKWFRIVVNVTRRARRIELRSLTLPLALISTRQIACRVIKRIMQCAAM